MNAKRTLRDEARKKRAELAHVHVDFPARVAEHAADLGVAEGSLVGGYAAMRDEADPGLLIKRLEGMNCLLAYPRVAANEAPLAFHVVRPGSALAAGAFGVPEPPADGPLVTPQILLVPLLAFDAAGHRLGYGGGHYDRTLEALRADGPLTAIGVAFAGQEIAQIPGQRHDQRLDMVVTELGVRRFL